VWDVRTRVCVRTLAGHTHNVATVQTQGADPQIISGSHDNTVKLWDLGTGRAMVTLTHHKKSIRGLAIHPTEFSFASGGADNIKVWKCPEGRFMRNIQGHDAIVNDLAINRSNVLVSGADDGSMCFWDWKTGQEFQRLKAPVQPGSLDSEAGVYAMSFDRTGTRLITCDADKSIKIYKQDDESTPETHPIVIKKAKKRKR
jgi:pleiotropic regulator 1